jgi:hypothetical protein
VIPILLTNCSLRLPSRPTSHPELADAEARAFPRRHGVYGRAGEAAQSGARRAGQASHPPAPPDPLRPGQDPDASSQAPGSPPQLDLYLAPDLQEWRAGEPTAHPAGITEGGAEDPFRVRLQGSSDAPGQRRLSRWVSAGAALAEGRVRVGGPLQNGARNHLLSPQGQAEAGATQPSKKTRSTSPPSPAG